MKKKLFLLIVLLSLFGATSFAHDLAVKNSDDVIIYYVWTKNNTELAVSFRGSKVSEYSNEYSGHIVIPSSVEYNGKKYSVTSIGYSAFQECSDLISVTIPNSVTSIESSAFQECSALTSVTIPENVADIGQRAFYMCSSVASIVVADGNTVYDSREGCNAIIRKSDNELMSGCKNTTIPNSVKNIGKDAFTDCIGLTQITIPDGITSIGDWTFNGSGLESITFPSSVETIGEFAFHYCTNLKSITFPSSVKSIGKEAFTGCPLNTVTVNWQEPLSVNEKIFNSNYTNETRYDAFLYVPKGCRTAYQNSDFWNKFSRIVEMDVNAILFEDLDVEAICLENWDTDGNGVLSKDEAAAVTSLGNDFNRKYELSSFNELQYFTGLTTIDDGTFEYCGELSSVIIPPNVKTIGKSAFASCGLTSVTISNGVETIGIGAFSGCSHLSSISIPSSVTSIGIGAFSNCGLTSIEIPKNVTTIESSTFHECLSLTSVKIPEGVTKMESNAFSKCSSLKTITIPSSLIEIDNSAITECGSLESIIVADGNAVYDSHGNCNAIIRKSDHVLMLGCKNTIIPNDVLKIEYNAFESSNIESITIPNSVKSIGGFAFQRCTNLSSVTIGSSVEVIGERAFQGCSSLTSITIPRSVNSVIMGAFSGCSSLASIVVEDGNTFYDSREGCNAIIQKSNNTLVEGCMNTIIPNDVSTIGTIAFSGRSGLKSITIPNSVSVIETGAFYECTNLATVTLGNRVKSIFNYAFFGCNNLKSINLPEGLETIGELAFDDCFSLTSITIPSSVKAIESACFAHCNSLTSINIPSSISSIDSHAFAECIALNSVIVNRQSPVTIDNSVFFKCPNPTLYVPVGCKEGYGNAIVWKDFKEIKEFVRKESTTYSVEEDKSLNVCVVEPTEKKVEIPESVTVDSKTYPVTAIAANAFENNTVIKEVSMPQTIEEIGDEAFAGCTSLSTIYCHADEPIALPTSGANARTRAGNQELTTNVFTGVDKVTCLLYVPAGSVNKYKAADGWKDFKYIVGIGTTFIIGNVNGDNVLDENDLNAIVNHIMGNPHEGSFDVNMADVNKDGDVNAADVVFLAKMLGQKE